MRGSLEQPPIVVQARRLNLRTQGAGLLFASFILLMFCLVGGRALIDPTSLTMSGSPSNRLLANLFIAFMVGCSALAVAAAASNALFPTRLTISPDGLKITTALPQRSWGWSRSAAWRWEEIRHFRRFRNLKADLVLFNFVDPGKSSSHSPFFKETGADGHVASALLYSDDLDDLVRVLNDARARWTIAEAPDEPAPAPPVGPDPIAPPAGFWTVLWKALMSTKVLWVGTVVSVAPVLLVLAFEDSVPWPVTRLIGTTAPPLLIFWLWLWIMRAMRKEFPK
jgi:hypothetical protein